VEEKMSTPAGDSGFLRELEIDVRMELTVAEVAQPAVAADAGPAVERPLDADAESYPDAESYADAERYEVSLRTLLGAIESVEDDPGLDHHQ
jgi:hypothetical protein